MFAVIALFVGSFIIYNTFSILVAQRAREMALLRAIGASRRQVLGSVLLEAVVVGLVASVVGLVAGIGVAAGLKALLDGIGIDIPAGGVVLTADDRGHLARRRARRDRRLGRSSRPAGPPKVPPVAAMRDVAVDTLRQQPRAGSSSASWSPASARRRSLHGLFGGGGNALRSSASARCSCSSASPCSARSSPGPSAGCSARPLPRLRGMTGTLARENAMRNPKRTVGHGRRR